MTRFIVVCLILAVITPAVAQDDVPVRVVVWDEQQPRQQEAYDNFLGNAIAEHLAAQPGLMVKSVTLDDEEQGLTAETLDQWDVIVWWGHVRQSEVTPETGQQQALHAPTGSVEHLGQRPHLGRRTREAVHQQGRMGTTGPAERFMLGRRRIGGIIDAHDSDTTVCSSPKGCG